ncbi:EAL domain-containing protein [Neorhizobium alkalisoli]|uniref:Amt family ammonium transporter n=1 Tax=Neorhizobium alkalisoli TaxID=528178 RepID=A0A561R1I5_9HYPH|nr:EAL domain-containing protein [Neorhizobium alkalisoli]TWF56470.1 Amt family ammonium transporter [Neorhizobium alkalisoli]
MASVAGLSPDMLFAGDGHFAASNLDLIWVLVAAVMVMAMQVGFLLLEAGMVRSKNSINVAQKNLLDFVFGAVAFAAVGFMMAFGKSDGLLPIGSDDTFYFLNQVSPWQSAFFVFQVMFCGMASTIVSGAVAERMKLAAYVFASLFMSVLIYPAFVHWAWGNALFANSTAFLANMGFVDFAGSTVVHSTGGWMALAACLVIGPRLGKYGIDGSPVRIAGHNPVLATTGAMMLFTGWIGLTSGATLGLSHSPAPIIVNTVLAGGMGACIGYVLGFFQDGVILPEKSSAGLLGGLVAVTAGCDMFNPAASLMVGAIGGAVAIFGNAFVERVLKVDDAVGAIGVHAFAGVAGTLLVALFAPLELLPAGSRLGQLQIQMVGAGVNFYWSFGLGYIFFRILGRIMPIRVSLEDEDDGLNMAEHGTRLGVGHVENALGDLLDANPNLQKRLPIVRGDESERLTGLFNRLMNRLEDQERSRGELLQLRHDREEAERVATLANATFEAIMIHRNGLVVDGNEQLSALVGLPLSELVGTSIYDFLMDGETMSIAEIVQLNDDTSYEISISRPNGECIPVQARGRDIVFRGETARVGCFFDLRERKQAEQRIRHLAQHDALTGLPNRVLFSERLKSLVNTAGPGRSCGVVMVDLDRFKDINDIHGHQAGDAVIRATANRLAAVAGEHASAARLGGDEFAVLLCHVENEAQLEDFGARILQAMAEPIDIGFGEQVNVSVSIGGALCPDHAQDSDPLVGCADIALYHAKNAGRNAFRLFRKGMNELIEKRRALEADLEIGLKRGEFELYLQPRVEVETADVIGYEALLRWSHPKRGMISPGDFIPVAEASGKIIQLGEWVLAEACRLLETIEGRISVNVSPLQFRHSEFVSNLTELLRRTGADPNRIELEITENVLIDDDKRALQILNDLKKIGFDIALDDFGTGYSSLSYLSRYPFDTIKIDRSFVSNIGKVENAQVIVRTIIDLGAGLGMNTVAEGVERIEEALFLAQAGCDELQGYLLGRPARASELARDIDPAIATRLRNMPRRLPEIQDDSFESITPQRMLHRKV